MPGPLQAQKHKLRTRNRTVYTFLFEALGLVLRARNPMHKACSTRMFAWELPRSRASLGFRACNYQAIEIPELETLQNLKGQHCVPKP